MGRKKRTAAIKSLKAEYQIGETTLASGQSTSRIWKIVTWACLGLGLVSAALWAVKKLTRRK